MIAREMLRGNYGDVLTKWWKLIKPSKNPNFPVPVLYSFAYSMSISFGKVNLQIGACLRYHDMIEYVGIIFFDHYIHSE